MNKNEKTKVLSTYQDIIKTLKTSVITDLITAMSTGQIEVSETEYERITSLLANLIEVYGANGHELFQRILK